MSQEPFISISQEYVPALPNTGFEPVDAAQVAFAAVFLIALGVIFFPHVKRAITSLIR